MTDTGGLSGAQVHHVLHELDGMYESLMERADKAAADGSYRVASARAMKAHGVHTAQLALLQAVGISPLVWNEIHRRAS